MGTAWTNINTGEKVIKPGEDVSAGDVGGDEGYDALVAAGAIKEVPYPVPEENSSQSPVEYLRSEAARLAEEATVEALAGADIPEVPRQPAVTPQQIEQAQSAMEASAEEGAEPAPALVAQQAAAKSSAPTQQSTTSTSKASAASAEESK